jgi:hypothetical protein
MAARQLSNVGRYEAGGRPLLPEALVDLDDDALQEHPSRARVS